MQITNSRYSVNQQGEGGTLCKFSTNRGSNKITIYIVFGQSFMTILIFNSWLDISSLTSCPPCLKCSSPKKSLPLKMQLVATTDLWDRPMNSSSVASDRKIFFCSTKSSSLGTGPSSDFATFHQTRVQSSTRLVNN